MTRPYHHGHLERAAIDAAVDEVRAVGVGAVSMRQIARRAGVSHAALAYQFGDKAGIFTAVATEGFQLAAAAIGPVAEGPNGFQLGGQAYVGFALEHPAHFEVMFRPNLYRGDDPALAAAKKAAFDVLYDSARGSLLARRTEVTDDQVRGLVIAGWSMSHGFATLALTGNLAEQLDAGPAALADLVTHGAVTLGDLVERAVVAGRSV